MDKLIRSMLRVVRSGNVQDSIARLVQLANREEPDPAALEFSQKAAWETAVTKLADDLFRSLRKPKLKPHHTGICLLLDGLNMPAGEGIHIEAGRARREKDDYEWTSSWEVDLGQVRCPILERFYSLVETLSAWDYAVAYGFVGLALRQMVERHGCQAILNGAEFRRVLWCSHEMDPSFEFGDITAKRWVPHLKWEDQEPQETPDEKPMIDLSDWPEDERLATKNPDDWFRLVVAARLQKMRHPDSDEQLGKLAETWIERGGKKWAKRVEELITSFAKTVDRPEAAVNVWHTLYDLRRALGEQKRAAEAERNGRAWTEKVAKRESREWFYKFWWVGPPEEALANYPGYPVLEGKAGEIESDVDRAREAKNLKLLTQCQALLDGAWHKLLAMRKGAARNELLQNEWSRFVALAHYLEDRKKILGLESVQSSRIGESSTELAEAMFAVGANAEAAAYLRKAVVQQVSLAKKYGTDFNSFRYFIDEVCSMLGMLHDLGDADAVQSGLAALEGYLKGKRLREPELLVQRDGEMAKLYAKLGRGDVARECVARIRDTAKKLRVPEFRASAWSDVASALAQLGDTEGAEDTVKKLRPVYQPALRVEICLLQQRWQDAFREIKKLKSCEARADSYVTVADRLTPPGRKKPAFI